MISNHSKKVIKALLYKALNIYLVKMGQLGDDKRAILRKNLVLIVFILF